MDVRKVHRVGLNSLAVTLPGQWVRQVGLAPGDPVAFLLEDDSSLVVVRPNERGGPLKKALVTVEAEAIPGKLTRMLIGCYMVGYDAIEFRAQGAFTAEQLDALRSTVSRLTGMAVLECKPEVFVAQSYLDPSWAGLGEHLHRLLDLTEGMVAKAPALINRDTAAAREVLELGDQADRLYYLAVRSLLAALSDRPLRARMGLDAPQEVTGCRVIAKALEEVGDSMEILAEVVLQSEGTPLKLSAEVTDEVASFSRRVCGHLSVGVESFLDADPERAETVLRDIYELEHAKHDLIAEVARRADSPAGAAFLMVAAMALRDVCRFARVVGEVALNNALRCGVTRVDVPGVPLARSQPVGTGSRKAKPARQSPATPPA